MFSEYFDGFEIKSEYSKEFISLWRGWLGKDECHKLSEVTVAEWDRFNNLLESISKNFILEAVDFEKQSLIKIKNIESVLSDYEESMEKTSSIFTRLVVPDLKCVISEEWDYTYIIWHKNNGAVEILAPYIKNSKLEHFRD